MAERNRNSIGGVLAWQCSWDSVTGISRTVRNAPAGLVYHRINRAVARQALFHKDEDYAAFERVCEK